MTEAIQTFLMKVIEIEFVRPISEIPEWLPGEPYTEEMHYSNLLHIEKGGSSQNRKKVKELKAKLKELRTSKPALLKKKKQEREWKAEVTEMTSRTDEAIEQTVYKLGGVKWGNDTELLLPYSEDQVKSENMHLSLLYHDAIQSLSAYLINFEASFKSKKNSLCELRNIVEKCKSNYTTFNGSILKLAEAEAGGEGEGTRKLSKDQIPTNTWALVELHKRYMFAFAEFVNTSCALLHQTFVELIRVPETEIKRFIWYNQGALIGPAFEKLFNALIRQEYIHNETSLSNFQKAFKAGSAFERIVWLKDVRELHALIGALNERGFIISVSGNIWEAAVTTFRYPNGLDINYETIQTNRRMEDDKRMMVILNKCFGENNQKQV